jgi:hypothetical protein
MTQVLESLCSKCEAQSSNPSTAKKKKNFLIGQMHDAQNKTED